MESFEPNTWLMISIASLVSFGKLVQVLFRTLRTCVREYYGFRDWLIRFRRARPGGGGAERDAA
jgi:hypothetical protein